MSAQSSSSRAAQMAAAQVESIVAAAQEAADEIRARAESEAQERLREADLEAERVRSRARAETEKTRADTKRDVERQLKDARAEAEKISADARRQASDRVHSAQLAAEEAMKQTTAVTDGMRRLGETLEGQAARMLRDVQAGHRRILADLRVPEAAEPAPRPRRAEPAEVEGEDAERIEAIRAAEARRSSQPLPRRTGGETRRANPFDDLEVPGWVDKE